jgi:hypothetical protein
MSDPGPLPPEMEIANLEHELTVLRERYSTMLSEIERMKRIFKYGGSVTLAVAVAALIYSASKNTDALPILFLVTGLVVVIGLMAWLFKDHPPAGPDAQFRFYDQRYPFRTDEEFLNHAIAIREKRLSELRAAP